MPLKRYTCKLDGYAILIPAAETADGMLNHAVNIHHVGPEWRSWFTENVDMQEISALASERLEINRE